ncbi:hypothetical protein BZA77DRAFT_384310 [Pyronema omphalodes]|nr:hypothetical protein BZA77DRAFT_384310 [Pyronema omphalodes]
MKLPLLLIFSASISVVTSVVIEAPILDIEVPKLDSPTIRSDAIPNVPKVPESPGSPEVSKDIKEIDPSTQSEDPNGQTEVSKYDLRAAIPIVASAAIEAPIIEVEATKRLDTSTTHNDNIVGAPAASEAFEASEDIEEVDFSIPEEGPSGQVYIFQWDQRYCHNTGCQATTGVILGQMGHFNIDTGSVYKLYREFTGLVYKGMLDDLAEADTRLAYLEDADQDYFTRFA